MLSQFTKEGEHQTLADLSEKFPIDVYPVGRLDADSEGLLLLTNDKRVNKWTDSAIVNERYSIGYYIKGVNKFYSFY